jgi:hypothetical protein
LVTEGRVEGILAGAQARGPLEAPREVRVEAGPGLEGERYWSGQGTFWMPLADREGTLTEKQILRFAQDDTSF